VTPVALPCPNCAEPMEPRSFARLYGRSVTLDVCRHCQGLWFDGLELLQLSPGATLELFASLGLEAGTARRPLAATLRCTRCQTHLREAHDTQRTTRFSYFTCPAGHGRWLTFYQFLRAKNFVRSLARHEIDELRRHITQVHCANCGAPIDLDAGATCGFCRTPVAMIDPDQIGKVVAELGAAERERQQVDPTLPLRLATERARSERVFAEIEGRTPVLPQPGTALDVDLVGAGLQALAEWLTRRS